MDRIYLNHMEFYGYHGVYPEENKLGQRFIVDLIAKLDLRKAGENDDLTESVSYAELFETCREIVEGEPCKLIETVAEKIAAACLQRFPKIETVTVTVIKPDPPINGHFHSMAVEITRSREIMKHRAYLSLGSNLGDRYENLARAIGLLDEYDEIELESCSSIYETDPVGYVDQERFLNMVISIRTALSPFELLKVCQEIEQKLGRKRLVKWGPRSIDLDILLYNQENIETEQLTVPHPRMLERAFVLIPLLEIDDKVQIPGTDKPLSAYLQEIPDREGVQIWKRKNGEDVFALFEN